MLFALVSYTSVDVMYACVKYNLDRELATVHVSLIKDFEESWVLNYKNKTVKAYWRSDDGAVEGYYDASILMLGGKHYVNSFSIF